MYKIFLSLLISIFLISCSDPFYNASEILSSIHRSYGPEPETIILGGDFEFIDPDNGYMHQGLTALTGNGNIDWNYFSSRLQGILGGYDWNTSTDKGVFSVAFVDNTLYAAGNFDGFDENGDSVFVPGIDDQFKMLIRFENGHFDSGYMPAKVLPASDIYTVEPLGDNLLIGGSFSAPFNQYFTMLDNEGIHNALYPVIDTGANVDEILVNDDLLLIGGAFIGVDAVMGYPNVALMNSAGQLTAPNAIIPTVANNAIKAMELTDKGSLYLGGIDGAAGTILKLDYDPETGVMTEDTQFHSNFMTEVGRNPGASFDEIYVLTSDQYGRIYAGGRFKDLEDINGGIHSALIRLTENGYVDPSFQVNFTGANPKVHDIKIQQNGKILIGGIFTYLNGNANSPDSSNGILRLYEDGSVDPDFEKFSLGTGFDIGLGDPPGAGEYATVFSIAIKERAQN